MATVLSFIVPVPHPANARNWPRLRENLAQTIRSISAQNHPDWRAVVVANHGSDLPPMPSRFSVTYVDFAPNRIDELDPGDRNGLYDAVRLDKGRRVLAGMLEAGQTDYFMIVDDDDLVSDRLAGFVAANRGCNGWFLRDGYVWSDGGKLLYLYDDFSNLCGTSHIVRADLYGLPGSVPAATGLYLQRHLGSHIFIEDLLAERGTPLAPLPFPGAVYRIGHSESVSRSRGILRTFIVGRNLLSDPLRALRSLRRLRPLTGGRRREFFGRAAPSEIVARRLHALNRLRRPAGL